MNGAASLGLASTVTASITKPPLFWARQSRSRAGISSRHGGHHVAQKLMKTGFPRCADSLNVWPPAVGIVKSSANFGLGGRISSSSLIASSRLSDFPEVERGEAAGPRAWLAAPAAMATTRKLSVRASVLGIPLIVNHALISI